MEELHDVSNAKGGKVVLDGVVVEIGGPGTRNDGIVEFKTGKISVMAKENTGTITFANGVTGTLLLCKNDGTIINKGKVKVTIKADDPFCSRTVTKATKKSDSLAPELFYCRNSVKYSKIIFNAPQSGKKAETCSDIITNLKENWSAVRREVDAPDFKRFFDTCCDPARIAPKGMIYKLKKRIIKRKIVEAKTTVSIDFTKDENKDKKEKFKAVYIKRANAKKGTFIFKKRGDSSRRRLLSLSEGTDVTVTLEYDNDTAAEAGKSTIAANSFASELRADLKKEGVDTTVTETS